MQLVSLVRHKNGKRYLPRLVAQLTAISDAVVFLDDNSTDGSYEELMRLKNVHKEFYVIRRTQGGWSGGLDWRSLFAFADRFHPDWIYCPDVDELLEESEAMQIRRLAEQSAADILGWSFPFYYLWNNETTYRDDGVYNNTSVIRLIRYNKNFPPPDRATHATAVSDDIDRRLIRMANVRMWHFGYMLEADRKSKYDFYTSRDKDPEAAGSGGKNYDHMINAPEKLPGVPSLSRWKDYGLYCGLDKLDHLQWDPVRVSIGAFFPAAAERTLSQLPVMYDGMVDEVRISYHFDSMKLSDIKETLGHILRILRSGGRLDVISNNFDNICRDYSSGGLEVKTALQNKFLVTPHREPLKIVLSADIMGSILNSCGFSNVQMIDIPESPYRLYMMATKPAKT